jgi:tRNA dimethylallyltransferase
MDLANPARVLRALEVCRTAGRPFSEVRSDLAPPPCAAFVAGLRWERDELYRRIDARVDVMMSAGFEQEVRRLLDEGVERDCQAFNTVGYKEMIRYLSGELAFPAAVELIKRHTRNFAKRQLTWFRKERRIHWYDVRDERGLREIYHRISEDFLRSLHNESNGAGAHRI